MAGILERLSDFGQKIEKKAPLRLTEEEKKIVEEIDQWRKGRIQLSIVSAQVLRFM
jgi:hypothetical protein